MGGDQEQRGGANRARFTAAEGFKTYQRLLLGDAATGAELEVSGGTLFTDATAQTRIAELESKRDKA